MDFVTGIISSALQSEAQKVAFNSARVLAEVVSKAKKEKNLYILNEILPAEIEKINREIAKNAENQIKNAVANCVNALFTSDVTAPLIGWSNHAPISDNRLRSDSTIMGYWKKALSRESPLGSQTEFNEVLLKRAEELKTTPELLIRSINKFTSLEPWGVPANDPKPKNSPKPVILMEMGDVIDLIKITKTKEDKEGYNPEGSEDAFKDPKTASKECGLKLTRVNAVIKKYEDLKLLLNGTPRHLAYEFALPTGKNALHHAVFIGDEDEPDLMVEVQNLLIDEKVTGIVSPSTFLNFLYRIASNEKNGLLEFQYKNALPLKIVQERALACLGSWPYHLLFNNCEHFVTWVMMNKASSEDCALFLSAISFTSK